jgi:hypothetical protein
MTLVGNGIFRPIIVADGKVIGIWTRVVEKKRVVIKPKFFSGSKKLNKKEIEELIQPFGHFLSLDVHVK